MTSGTLVIWSLSRLDNGTRMPCPNGFSWSAGSNRTASGMGHWKRLIKIPGGTDCYYCLNHLTCSTHGYYSPFLFVTLPDMLSTLMSHVYLVALLDICYTPCGDTLFMYMYNLHCIYSALCIRCRLHYCIYTTQ